MKYNFDELIDRKGSDCLKYDAVSKFFGKEGDILPLWIADGDFAVPSFITDALHERINHPVFGYTLRSDRFYQALSTWYERRGGWKIEAEWVDYTPGIVSGLAFAIEALTEKGDGVLIQTPVYPPFINIVNHNERELLCNELINTDGYYTIDFEDFEEKAKKAKLFILCNPHNPVGRVYTPSELKRMGDICVKHNLMIISDEIHCDIVMKGYKHTHIATVSEEIAERTITFLAPSKTFNVAGLSTAVSVCSNKELKDKFNALLLKFHIELSTVFGNEALIAAFTHGDEWLSQANEYVEHNFAYVSNYIKENMPKLKVFTPEATYLMWLDFSALGISEDELQQSLLDDAKVALNRGSDYGTTGTVFMRLNTSCPLSTLQEAMKRIQITYDKYCK